VTSHPKERFWARSFYSPDRGFCKAPMRFLVPEQTTFHPKGGIEGRKARRNRAGISHEAESWRRQIGRAPDVRSASVFAAPSLLRTILAVVSWNAVHPPPRRYVPPPPATPLAGQPRGPSGGGPAWPEKPLFGCAARKPVPPECASPRCSAAPVMIRPPDRCHGAVLRGTAPWLRMTPGKSFSSDLDRDHHSPRVSR